MACLKDSLPNQWWRSTDKIGGRYPIEIEVEAHGSVAAAARAHGVAKSTAKDGYASLHLPPLPSSRAKIGPGSPDEVDAPISELERVRQENAELRRYVKRDREGDIAEARVIDALLAAIPAAHPLYKPPAAKRSKREPHSMAVLFSDVHASEVVREEETLGLNAYDWDTMLRRMARMQNSILAHQEHLAAPVDELNVWMLGDMLSGDIHDELARTNDRPTAQAAVDFGYECGSRLERFAAGGL